MAHTITIDGKGVIANAIFSSETWDKSGLISAPGDETDIVLQGSNAVSSQASNKSGWMLFDIGSGNELDFSASGTEEDQLLYLWFNVTTVGILDTLGNKGLAIQLGSGTDYTNFDYWTICGSDGNENGYTGGWMCAVLDVSNIARTGYGGSGLDKSAVRYFGLYIDTTGSSKSDNLIIDQIAVGNGLRITGSYTSESWQEVSDYCNDFSSRAWGMLQERAGIFYAYGRMYIGDTSQSAATSWSDSAKVVQFGDFKYYTGSAWASAVGNSHNGITKEDDSGGTYSTTFNDGAAVGSDAGRSGCVYIGASDIDTTFDLYAGNVASSLTTLYGTIMQGIDGGVTFGNDSDHKCFSVTFQECGQVDPVGAIQIRNCLFVNTVDTGGALIWNANIDIEDCKFIANTTGPAIEHPAEASSEEYHNLTFSGNTNDVNNAVNATQVDAYADTNRDTAVQLYSGSTIRIAQSFTGAAGELSRAIFSLQKVGSPSGNVVAKLYSDSSGPDAVLATSEDVAIGDIGTSWAQVDFEFEDEYTMAGATTYWISVEYSGGDSSNRLEVGVDNSTPGHGGTCETYVSSWTGQAYDMCFYVNRDGIVSISATYGANPAESKTTETGSPKGATIISNEVTLIINTIDSNNDAVANVSCAIYRDSDDLEIMNEDSSALGVASEPFPYPGADFDVYWRVRESPAAGSRYKPKSGLGEVTTDGFVVTVVMEPETVS